MNQVVPDEHDLGWLWSDLEWIGVPFWGEMEFRASIVDARVQFRDGGNSQGCIGGLFPALVVLPGAHACIVATPGRFAIAPDCNHSAGAVELHHQVRDRYYRSESIQSRSAYDRVVSGRAVYYQESGGDRLSPRVSSQGNPGVHVSQWSDPIARETHEVVVIWEQVSVAELEFLKGRVEEDVRRAALVDQYSSDFAVCDGGCDYNGVVVIWPHVIIVLVGKGYGVRPLVGLSEAQASHSFSYMEYRPKVPFSSV